MSGGGGGRKAALDVLLWLPLAAPAPEIRLTWGGSGESEERMLF